MKAFLPTPDSQPHASSSSKTSAQNNHEQASFSGQSTERVLSAQEKEKTKQYSVIDGSAYNVMYGFGEQYVVPYGVRLGASPSEVALLSTVPYFFGSLFQLLGARLTWILASRKRIILISVLIQAIMFLPIFLLPLLTKNIFLLIVLFSLYLIFANMATPAWSSLIGDVVGEHERSSFFSHRNKVMITFLFFSVIAAGLILHYFENRNVWLGFGILFGVALLARIVSLIYLARHHEPTYHPPKKSSLSFFSFTKSITKTPFGTFTLFRFLLTIGIMFGAPFFVVFNLKFLELNYFQYMLVILVPLAAKVISMKPWGKYAERYGTRNIMIVSLFLISSFPIFYFLGAYFFGKSMTTYY
ncbi:MAG: MFS transporter, partial [Candidatus Woesearchaeota archaeon]